MHYDTGWNILHQNYVKAHAKNSVQCRHHVWHSVWTTLLKWRQLCKWKISHILFTLLQCVVFSSFALFMPPYLSIHSVVLHLYPDRCHIISCSRPKFWGSAEIWIITYSRFWPSLLTKYHSFIFCRECFNCRTQLRKSAVTTRRSLFQEFPEKIHAIHTM